MYLLIVGLGLLVWNFNRIGLVADMSWWWVLSPFALAVAWWAWADWSGYTKKKAMQKMDKRKEDRLAKARNNLGLGPRRK